MGRDSRVLSICQIVDAYDISCRISMIDRQVFTFQTLYLTKNKQISVALYISRNSVYSLSKENTDKK